MIKDSQEGSSREHLSGEGSGESRPFEPIQERNAFREPVRKVFPQLPHNGPDRSRGLDSQNIDDQKFYQVNYLDIDLQFRLKVGDLALSGKSPQSLVEEAAQMKVTDINRTRKLRQAAIEYVILAVRGDETAGRKAKKILTELLYEDRDLAEGMFEMLMETVQADTGR